MGGWCLLPLFVSELCPLRMKIACKMRTGHVRYIRYQKCKRTIKSKDQSILAQDILLINTNQVFIIDLREIRLFTFS